MLDELFAEENAKEIMIPPDIDDADFDDNDNDINEDEIDIVAAFLNKAQKDNLNTWSPNFKTQYNNIIEEKNKFNNFNAIDEIGVNSWTPEFRNANRIASAYDRLFEPVQEINQVNMLSQTKNEMQHDIKQILVKSFYVPPQELYA